MPLISTFQFNKKEFTKLKDYHYGINWPVVYFIENGKEGYIGQTTSVFSRSKQHYERQDRSKLDRIHIITDDEYNLSAVYDIESWLIQYLTAEGKFILQNGNRGLRNHNYYDKEKYRAKFEIIWKELQKMEFTKKDLVQIENSDTFKYSPYKALTEEQLNTSDYIIDKIIKNNSNTFIVNGGAGTGKTVLATYMIKQLISDEDTKHFKVALVIGMTGLRSTIKRVFQNIKGGLKSSMVIGPNDVTKDNYDILIVDEAHRLKRRQNLTNYKSFDDTNRKLGFDNEGTELDWIIKSSKHQIFLYDSFQSVKPTDVLPGDFDKLNAEHLYLKSQLRVSAGDDYIDFIHSLLNLSEVRVPEFKNYDFQIIHDIDILVSKIKQKNTQYGLSRVVAGYSWDWKSKKGDQDYDIEIGTTKLKWNSTNIDWVNSPNSINEIGCIHTIQGYDLNYVGVIIGNEISYDDVNHKIIINKEHYRDTNGYRGVTDEEELKQYILNIYKTLLTRGIKGTYVYICDNKLRRYFNKYMKAPGSIDLEKSKKSWRILTLDEMNPFKNCIPLFHLYASAGKFSNTQEVEDCEWITLPENIKLSEDLFACMVVGESMNKIIPNGSVCLFRRDRGGSRNGKIVLAEVTDTQDIDSGSGYTVKRYESIKKYDGDEWMHSSIILKPLSTDLSYKELVLKDYDSISSFNIVGIFERVL